MTDTASLTGTYTLDPSHSRLGFVVRHAMVTKVRGNFADIAGTVTVNGEDPTASSVQVTAAIASITTGDEARDGHLRSADFFDLEAHPNLTFTATTITADGDDEFTVTGDLTINGITKPVTIDLEFTGAATDPFGNHRIGFEGSGEINRKDFGVQWNATLETGGVLVGDKVKLELDISAVAQSD
jgi:polyisoprenoid-binding protein YceI